MGLVSVVMPVYNCEAYVREAVRSVFSQTERHFELIAVDDGSTDATPAILAALALEDDRLQVHTQPNSGKASIARNAGVALARGEFVAFIDGDDVFHPRRLERNLNAFAHMPDVGLVFSDLVHFASDEEMNRPGHLTRSRFLETARQHLSAAGTGMYRCNAGFFTCLSTRAFGVVTPQTVMVRRKVLQTEPVWFPEHMVTYEDNDLWLRLALHTRFAYIDEVLAYYRQHSASITADGERMAVGAIMAKTRNLERGKEIFSTADIRYCRHTLAEHYFNLGYLQARRGDNTAARRSYLSAARLRPGGAVLLAILKTLVFRRLLDLARQILRR